ncbi:uncharacterized protein LOC110693664 [Chenopodium quinoa]|uniref:uncharacterized protein LOC110693664 n=1 Tax=Chenopodium quinoa TaxID=63459 RepID=UPI000B784616|nr:uncharacterized protein LOC110693664 [Chenopodium quinoa]
MENRERGIGWPLGLGSMYMRLRLVEGLPVSSTSDRARSSFCFPSSSFSSFSSSNLDTESTASFFQDNSKSLGRIIGIRPRNSRSELYSSRNTAVDRSETTHRLSNRSCSEHGDELDIEMCDGICIPLCLYAKVNKNKDGSKR